MNDILEAASAIFAEVGYEAATTNEIAARAKTSIGSLYRFFPDKLSIFRALSKRYMEKIARMVIHDVGTASLLQPLPVLIERMLLSFDRFLAEEPAFAKLLVYSQASPELRAIDATMRMQAIEAMTTVMLLKGMKLPEDRRHLIGQMMIELCNAYFRARSLFPETEHGTITDEFKRIILAYLDSYRQ
jgi:AcrR family transcriptional regulator